MKMIVYRGDYRNQVDLICSDLLLIVFIYIATYLHITLGLMFYI